MSSANSNSSNSTLLDNDAYILFLINLALAYQWYVRLVIVLGFASNVVWATFIIWKRQPKSVWVYLAVVAIGDSLFLVALATTLIRYSYFHDPNFYASWLCQITMFITQATRSITSWTWVIMAANRLLFLIKPMQALSRNDTRKRYNRLLTGNVALWCLLQLYMLFLAEDKGSDPEFGGCDVVKINKDSMSVIIMLDIIVSYFLPFALLISINIAFFKLNLERLTRRRAMLIQPKQETRAQTVERKSWSVMKTAAFVALIDVSLNVPNQVIRILHAFNSITSNSSAVFMISHLSFAIFYSQFLLNNAYFYSMVCKSQRLQKPRKL